MYHFCYKTTNTVNGKFYLGKHSTDNLNDGYLGSGDMLLRALKKYGKNNFKREVLCFFNSPEEALEFEEILVDQRVVDDDRCYNLKLGGNGGSQWNKGMPMSEEQRTKISRANTGNPKMIASLQGRTHSSETKAKMSASRVGKPRSEETKARISEAKKGKPGIKPSEESKAKMSAAKKGKPKGRVNCPCCGLNVAPHILARWHGDKCLMRRKQPTENLPGRSVE